MRWLVDGYNVIRRSPVLAACERQSLAAGRRALWQWLMRAHRISGDDFVVVFDGAGPGGADGGAGVRVVFSSARETADRVLARLAAQGGAVVSNDREVRRAASRGGAFAVSADDFLARIERLDDPADAPVAEVGEKEDDEPGTGRPRKGNPRRAPKRGRAAARALGRLAGRPPRRP